MSWLVLPVVAYLGWAALLFVGQRRMLYPRHLLRPPPDSATFPEGVERIGLDTGTERVEAFYLPPAPGDASGGRPAILFAHGNGELATDWIGAYRSFALRGIPVLLVEYPGYGHSSGSPDEASLVRAVKAGYDWMAGRPEVDEDRIVGVGRSLGGGAVGGLTRERELAGLVLQSTFTSTRPFARRMLVPSFLVLDVFDNLRVVRDFPRPILVIHGRRDEVIPFEHGRRLAEAADSARLVEQPCGHNDCPVDWNSYVELVAGFVHGTPSGS